MSNSIKFGPVKVAEGFSRLNASGLLIAAFTSIPLVSFLNFVQPYLLIEVFQVPEGERGVLTGQLAAFQESIVLLCMAFVGAASDNFGRRIVMVVGVVILGLGLIVYPLAEEAMDLYAYRIPFALGAAMVPVMYSTYLHDVSHNDSRGKFTAMGSFCTGLGMVLLATQAGRIPLILQERGFDPITAGRYTYWSMVIVAVIVAVLVTLTWKKGRFGQSKEKTPMMQLVKQGFSEAFINPKIALSYMTAFASRGDLVVIGTFTSLWVSQVAPNFNLTTAEGLARAGMMVGVIQAVAMFWAFVMGILADKINRVLGVCIGFSIATFAYINMYFIVDPFISAALIACVFLGMGEISAIVTASALLGEEANDSRRGSIIGVFSMIGASAILLGTYFGGVVFDSYGPTSPFMMMGIVNGIVAIAALLVYLKTKN